MLYRKVHPLALNIIVGTFFARMATSMSISFLAIYLTTEKSISPQTTGIIIGTSSLAAVFTSFFGGSLSDRYGRKNIMLISMTAWIIVF